MDELRAHPTAKPVALIADAIRDCTRRRDIVLDLFAGSGATIMAAERVGRVACAMEIEPRYVDIAIRRWQAFTRKDAVHAESGCTFDELADKRAGAVEPMDQLSASTPSVAPTRRKPRSDRRKRR
jgi:tRNA/tmRNA/rRNA uracil-C5-methylase (TrmA/RlmC/RlmD family)